MSKFVRSVAVATAIATVATGAISVPAAAAEQVSARSLHTSGMHQPLGVGDATPALSWQLASTERGAAQTAFQVQVASSEQALIAGDADLWDTGKLDGDKQRLHYAGAELGSRDRAYWRVKTWNGDEENGWSDPTWFEIGLLDSSDWSANWVTNADWQLTTKTVPSVTVKLPETTSRYVRLNVSELGLPLAEQILNGKNATDLTVEGSAASWPNLTHRLQLAEFEVRNSDDPETNFVPLDHKPTVSEEDSGPREWDRKFLTDGQLTTNPQDSQDSGYQSKAHASADISDNPITLEFDLGEERTFDEVVLYPRTDTLTAEGRTPAFPSDFSIETTADPASGEYETLLEVEDQETPDETWLPEALPLFASEFTADSEVVDARLYVSGVGIYAPTLNGERVGDAMLEPGNTDLDKRIPYAVYDVSDLIQDGENALGVAVGNGSANSLHVNGRYRKFARTSSDLQVIAQLEMTYADGTRKTVGSDDTWRTTLGATTSSNWYGGEDYDARRANADWASPEGDRGSWEGVVKTEAPAGSAELVARQSEPIRVVEELPATELERTDTGSRMFDLGRNVAAIPEITVDAPADTTIRVYPAESRKDGHVDQSISNVGAPIWDQFTSAGEKVTWHPEFSYHGFRYLEVAGLPDDASIEVTGLRVMADNPSAGDLEISDEIMDGIHEITEHALESNMMSVLTDAPSREKLGWLEQTHLVFDTIARNYDVEAYMSKVVQDIADGQEESGMVVSTVPDYTFLAGSYRDDPNWGGALVRVPLKYYNTYGNDDLIRGYYDNMTRYAAYLDGREDRWVGAGVYKYGLGDWFTVLEGDDKIPVALVGTYGVWAINDGLAQNAAVLGKDDDADRYAARAQELREAMWAEFYEADADTFGSDDMGAIAMALDMGAVPEDKVEQLQERLVQLIEDADWHLHIGEVTFPSVLRALSDAGRDDVVVKVAQQTTSPSLGFQVANGNTSLGENWDGGSGQSQNHFMLGAMDQWLLNRIPGIEQTADSVGFKELLIDPAIEGDLTHASGSYETPYGLVESSWEVTDAAVTMDVVVPAGSTAEVHVPVQADEDGAFQVPITADGVQPEKVTDGEAIFHVPSGTWEFIAPTSQYGTNVALSVSEDEITVDTDLTVTATVTMDAGAATAKAADAGAPVAGGEVQFLVDGENVGDSVAVEDGTAISPSISSLDVGDHEITARFSGEGYASSEAGLEIAVIADGDGSDGDGSEGDESGGSGDDGTGEPGDGAAGGTDDSLPATGVDLTVPLWLGGGLLLAGLALLILRKRGTTIQD